MCIFVVCVFLIVVKYFFEALLCSVTLPESLLSEMLTIAVPVSGEAFDDWVSARINQYAKILEKFNVNVIEVFLRVNFIDFDKACHFKDNYVVSGIKVNVEHSVSVDPGTYWVEFETSNNSLDYVMCVRKGFSESRELGIFQGVFGCRESSEIMWTLWQVDKLDARTARRISSML